MQVSIFSNSIAEMYIVNWTPHEQQLPLLMPQTPPPQPLPLLMPPPQPLPLLMPPPQPLPLLMPPPLRRRVIRRPQSYTLAETNMMSDEYFAAQFIRLTNCADVRCKHCKKRIGDNPVAFIKTMRKRVSYERGTTWNPLGGLTTSTKPIKSCDEKSKYNDRANPGINPLYQAKRRTRDETQHRYIDKGISHVVKTAYWGCKGMEMGRV
jgi:hypothetical protein